MKRKNLDRLTYLRGLKKGEASAEDPRFVGSANRFVQNAKRQVAEAQMRQGSNSAATMLLRSREEVFITFPAAMAGPLKKNIVTS
jgi:hypothetical protein